VPLTEPISAFVLLDTATFASRLGNGGQTRSPVLSYKPRNCRPESRSLATSDGVLMGDCGIAPCEMTRSADSAGRYSSGSVQRYPSSPPPTPYTHFRSNARRAMVVA